jgi:Mrp family chromosome partitioning ATPase
MGHLNDNRIVAHDGTDPRSRAFDILRTQVRQAMDKEGWQVLGVTSPTPMCGKSVVAANLALSMARQPDRAVLLVDMDLQRPQISNYLGLRPSHGIIDVVEGRKTLSSAISRASFRSKHLLVLPCQKPTSQSSEMMASPSMAEMFQEIRRAYKDCTVIVDLPPILTGDHVIATLPHLDCAIFVAAVGNSTLAEVKECSKHFETTPILQVVVNKSTESTTSYYYQSAYAKMMPR